jgi:DNA repair protein RadC
MKSKWSFQFVVRETNETKGTYIREPHSVLPLVSELQDAVQEMVVVLDLSTKNRVLSKRLVSLGVLDASFIHPREVFRGAITSAASSIVVVHNHPSGDTTPSKEDLGVTRQLIAAGSIIGIPIVDHIIVGGGAHSSIRECGLVDFAKTVTYN